MSSFLTRPAGLAAVAVLAAAVFAAHQHPGADAAPDLLLPHGDVGNFAMAPETPPGFRADPGRWSIVYHGTCCEGNLAAAEDSTFVLLPVLVEGNKIMRSQDGGVNWTRQYPPVDASAPFGIEGDLQAYGDDVIYFGTELAAAVVAVSEDRGDTFTMVQVPVTPVVNDQAWSYLGPLEGVCPVAQTKPYVLAGWFRIGGAVIFSCDGGLTWPIQTPLVGNNGSGPVHQVCRNNAVAPVDGGDTRIADENFALQKGGRHGAFGTDGAFYWSEASGNSLYLCRSDDFGATWSGVAHPLAEGEGRGYTVTLTAFDVDGTLYVVHGDKVYVSLDRGSSFAFVHTLPRFGDFPRSDRGADQYFAMRGNELHLAVLSGPANAGEIRYLIGHDLASETPRWHDELVDVVAAERVDFMQIAIDGNGVPTLSYTTPNDIEEPEAVRAVTTASLQTDAPYVSLVVDALADPLSVKLDASASSALDGRALSYRFDFGDGTVVVQAEGEARHRYAVAGDYGVSVTVTDSAARESTAFEDISVGVQGVKAVVDTAALKAKAGAFGQLLLLIGLVGLARRR